jgi:hypothetical protein
MVNYNLEFGTKLPSVKGIAIASSAVRSLCFPVYSFATPDKKYGLLELAKVASLDEMALSWYICDNAIASV